MQDKREKERIRRREQLKSLIINRFRTKYTYGAHDAQERDRIISNEVAEFIENEKFTEKNLLELDKKLSSKFGVTKNDLRSQVANSRRNSQESRMSSKIGSEKSHRSAMMRAGLDISSQDGRLNASYTKYNRNQVIPGGVNMNHSNISHKPVDEWDNIIMNDVRKFEEEQKQAMNKKQELKRKVMEDLNAQIHEKRKLKNIAKENEKALEQRLEDINKNKDKRRKQQELEKNRKNQEERKIMATQIAEIENMKKFEKENDRTIAKTEKEKVDKALEDDLQRERRKKREYQEVCQKQYQENVQLKQYMKHQERQKEIENNTQKHKDMFGNMFEPKKHISYELAARNQKKIDRLYNGQNGSATGVMAAENYRTNKIKNYKAFEEGVNSLERKQKLDEERKKVRQKETQRINRSYLKEQMKFKEEHDKFEKELALNQAKQMNQKAQDELEREAKRQFEQRQKRVEHMDQLKTQMNFKANPYAGMTEQERLLNKEKLEV